MSEVMMVNLTTANWISGTNKYRYSFVQPLDFRNKKAKLMMYQYSVYNSTYNISKALGNNTYSIKWINGNTYNFTIPDGFYTFSDLNTNLQFNMAKNYLYLQSTSNASQVLYFIAFSANTVLYKAQIDVNYVPKTMPSGYSYPINMPVGQWTIQSSEKYPQIILSKGLQTLFGFSSQNTFPLSQTAVVNNGINVGTDSDGNPLTGSTPYVVNQSFLSDTYPVLSPTFSYLLTCNLVDSGKISNIPTLFFQIPITSSYGKLISATVGNNGTGVSINPTVYNFLELSILDNNYNSIVFNDPELVISLLIQFENE